MGKRYISPTDHLISEIDNALRVITSKAHSKKKNPAGSEPEADLSNTERNYSAALMRVNHAGEVAAQALYRGQALVTRDPELREQLLVAADEEHDHLAWCEDRVKELGCQTSALSPLWYGGSFAIGIIAGLAGDKKSLGFLAETEDQVTAHLNSHLERLPAKDIRSKKIVSQMRDDEMLHSTHALEKGGEALAEPVRKVMAFASSIMTRVAHHI